MQLPLLARVNILDPPKVGPDLIVAEQQSFTDAKRQLKILRDAVQRTNGNPEVRKQVAWNLVPALRRAMDWDFKNVENQRKNAHLAAAAPQADFFVECIKPVVSADLPIDNSLMDIAYWLKEGGHSGGTELDGMIKAFLNLHFKAAQVREPQAPLEDRTGSCNEGLGPSARPDWGNMQFIIARAHLSLNHNSQAMDEAEMGATELPDAYLFHYIFALAALEKGERLEEAYERAKIGPSSPRITEM